MTDAQAKLKWVLSRLWMIERLIWYDSNVQVLLKGGWKYNGTQPAPCGHVYVCFKKEDRGALMGTHTTVQLPQVWFV